MASACGPCGFQADPGVKVVVPAMPTTLDWSVSDANDWANYPVLLATMCGLTSLKSDQSLAPMLATRWEVERTPEGRERYTFHLRHDVRWSDGTSPLTAEDFVVGWRRAVQGNQRGEMGEILGAREVLALLESGAPRDQVDAALERFAVRALDPHTLEVILTEPHSYFLSRLANVYLFFPAPAADLKGRSLEEIRDYFDRPREGRPLSLGPFRVETWDRAAERVRLVRNPHSAFAPKGAPVEVMTLMKSEIGPALYERGRVQFVFVDSPVALQAPPAKDLERRPLLSTYLMVFNTQRPPLDRREVREAIAYALDRDELMAGLLPAARVGNTLLPPLLPGASTPEQAAALPHFDLARARAALAAANVPLRPLRLLYRSDETFVPEVAIAERIKVQLARIGVTVNLEPRSDFSSEVARLAGDGFRSHDIYIRRIGADYAHPNTFFTFFERTGNHYSGWDHLDGGKLIDRFEQALLRGDSAPVQRGGEYAEAERLLLGEAVVVAPLYHPDRYFRGDPGLQGLNVDPFNFLSLRDVHR